METRQMIAASGGADWGLATTSGESVPAHTSYARHIFSADDARGTVVCPQAWEARQAVPLKNRAAVC